MDHNGSPKHRRLKKKMANLLRSKGYQAVGDNDDEAFAIRPDSAYPYFFDVFASNGERSIIVEIDGYKGHNSGRRIRHDQNRTNEIQQIVNHIEVFRFSFWQLKAWPEHEILEELKIC